LSSLTTLASGPFGLELFFPCWSFGFRSFRLPPCWKSFRGGLSSRGGLFSSRGLMVNTLSKGTDDFLEVFSFCSFSCWVVVGLASVTWTWAHLSLSLSATPSPAFRGGGRVGRAAVLASFNFLYSSNETPSGSSGSFFFSSVASAAGEAASSVVAAAPSSADCSVLASWLTCWAASSSTLGSVSDPQLAPPAPPFLFSRGPLPVPDFRS